jgi:hypothetical protein
VFELAIGLLAVPVLWAITQWRLGLLLCLATAILQDPLRKLTPDQPVLFVVFVGAVFAAACIGALARGITLNPNILFKRYPHLTMPLSLLLLLTIVQAFVSYLRFDNLLIPLIGVLTYVMPLFSIVFAYQLACRQGDFRIDQFMKWYVVCIALALMTVYLEFSDYDWSILGQVGEKLIIYDETTGAVMLPSSGLFRASEIAAWHAMTAACLVVVTFMQRTTFKRLLITVIVAALLIGVGLVTGRRKIVVEMAVFVATYFIFWIILEKRAGKLAIIALTTAALAGYAVLAGQLQEGNPARFDAGSVDYSSYVERSRSVFQEVPSRFVELGIAPVMWAYDRFGLFGAGLGVGTQGTQHFGGGGDIAGAAEGGLGKITLELGIPGLFVMGWCAILLVRYLWRIMRAASRQSVRVGRLSIGLFSLLVANVAGFSVATQAYGDLFVLLILGWMLGFLLAVPALVEREVCARQLAIFEEPPSVFRPKIVVSSRI